MRLSHSFQKILLKIVLIDSSGSRLKIHWSCGGATAREARRTADSRPSAATARGTGRSDWTQPGATASRSSAAYPTQAAATADMEQVRELLAVADDDGTRRRVADVVIERSQRGGALPEVDEVRRRYGAGLDPVAPSMTLDEWLAGKRKGRRGDPADVQAQDRRGVDLYVHVLDDIHAQAAESQARFVFGPGGTAGEQRQRTSVDLGRPARPTALA